MAGAGLNSTLFHPVSRPMLFGGGLNFKTDLGYNLSDHLSIELSSQVKFNQVKNTQVWDTLLTAGLRYAFPYTNNYLRAAIGRSPTVFFINENPELIRNTSASRVQADGEVYALGFGRYFKSKTNKIWYLEGGLSFQKLRDLTGIKDEQDVPIEIFNEKSEHPILLYSVYAIIGMRVF